MSDLSGGLGNQRPLYVRPVWGTAKVSSALRDIWDEVGTGPLLIYADILTLQTKEAFHVAQTQSTSVSWPLIVGLLLEFPLRFPVKYRSSPEMVVLR